MFEPSSMSPVYVLEVPGQNPFSPSKKPLGEKAVDRVQSAGDSGVCERNVGTADSPRLVAAFLTDSRRSPAAVDGYRVPAIPVRV